MSLQYLSYIHSVNIVCEKTIFQSTRCDITAWRVMRDARNCYHDCHFCTSRTRGCDVTPYWLRSYQIKSGNALSNISDILFTKNLVRFTRPLKSSTYLRISKHLELCSGVRFSSVGTNIFSFECCLLVLFNSSAKHLFMLRFILVLIITVLTKIFDILWCLRETGFVRINYWASSHDDARNQSFLGTGGCNYKVTHKDNKNVSRK